MNTMFKVLSLAAILAVAAAPAAYATDLTNSSLTQGPGSTSADKVYFGSGNQNSGFDVVTVANTNGGTLQLGLSAVVRYEGPITPSGNNYLYTPGPGTPAKNAADALWDFEFSVNTGNQSTNNFAYLITVTDTTTGKTLSFDPTLLPDDAQAAGSAVFCNGCAYNGTLDGFQNAENLGFYPSTPAFNPSAADDYTVTLTASMLPSLGGAVVATDTINVLPTPEPSSLVFLGTGLLGGIGTMLRRRRIA